jgi:hypothetical protein
MLFSQNFRQSLKPSRIVFKNNRLLLMDYGNLEIRLRPLELTVYLFFLRHPEGVALHDFVDYRVELKGLYGHFANVDDPAVIENNIEKLVDLRTNSLNEKISRIKRVLISTIGNSLSDHYIIQGEKREKRGIKLPASHIIIEE